MERFAGMYVVLGAGGHVGAAVANTLLALGHSVTVVTRSAAKAAAWQHKNAAAAVLDIHNTQALKTVFKHAKRAFLLNPPAAVGGNTDVLERQSVHAILNALRGVALEKIVVQSTYGAQAGAHCADLGVLYEFEQGAQQLGIPLCCVRAAYYMSNWCAAVPQVLANGVLSSVLPAAVPIAMVAPHDVGQFAAHLLAAPVEQVGTYFIEGPKRYTPAEVAHNMEQVLGRSVQVNEVPPEAWLSYYRSHGFSEQAAHSYAHMTEIFVANRYAQPDAPHKGATSLMHYMRAALPPLVAG